MISLSLPMWYNDHIRGKERLNGQLYHDCGAIWYETIGVD